MSARVLVVGGAGVFGRRLAEGLRATTDVEFIIAGRSAERAGRVARALSAEFVTLDRTRIASADLKALRVDIAIDAAGPFQGADCRFAQAVLEAGAHYVDLADARDFVAGFPALDALARARGRAAITGASSTPALTHAALDALCVGWRRIDAVRVGIAPGNRAPKGRSAVEAVLSRAGAPVRVWEGGAWAERRGWSHREKIGISGLGERRFALVETCDLDLIPARFAPGDSAIFMAALELPVLHRGIEAIAALRRFGLWRRPERAAAALTWCARLLEPFGRDCGAMFVEALGRDAEDKPCRARWTLLAPAGLGPIVPTLPALALVRKLLHGEIASGARACVGLVSLADLEGDFACVGFTTGIEREAHVSPFERALGDAFERLPEAVKVSHRAGPVARLVGVAEVLGPASPIAAMARFVVGFPRAAKAASVTVTKRANADGSETWTRIIGGRCFASVIAFAGPGLVRERFGPFSFDLRVSADEQKLHMAIVGWRIGPLPLPSQLAPRSLASESVDASGRFHFDVPIALPMAGRVTHYAGWLAPMPKGADYNSRKSNSVIPGPPEAEPRLLPLGSGSRSARPE